MRLKTSKEKAIAKEKKRREEYTKIAMRYKELVSKGLSKTDAVYICSNEFNCSTPKVYTARKEYDKFNANN